MVSERKSIDTIVRDVPAHWVGDGFPVRSLFNYQQGPRFDPFLLLDYAGPHTFSPSTEPHGVGEHPHRGFETVTIVYQGELEHRDSGGNHGSISAGDVQWMTAAGGVVHEEFHSERFSREGGVLEMVQLWVNLPAKEKLTTPRYQAIMATDIPTVALSSEAGSVRVIAGEFQGVRGPAQTFTPIHVWDLTLSAGGNAEFTVPEGFTTMLVVQHGNVVVNEEASARDAELVLLDRRGERFAVQAVESSRLLILSGKPLNEPIVGQGPFVMNTREQIREAISDFQSGRMGRLS